MSQIFQVLLIVAIVAITLFNLYLMDVNATLRDHNRRLSEYCSDLIAIIERKAD